MYVRIPNPQLVRSLGPELSLDQIRRRPGSIIPPRRRHEAAPCDAPQTRIGRATRSPPTSMLWARSSPYTRGTPYDSPEAG
jgi:hypothetical protein